MRSHVGGNVQTEGRFTHTGTCADKDQVGFTHTRQHAVQTGKSGRGTLCGIFIVLELMQVRVNVPDDLADVFEVFGVTTLRNGVNAVLRTLQNARYRVLLGVSRLGNVACHLNESAQGALFLDDACVVLDVECVGHHLGKRADVFLTAGFIVNALAYKGIDQRH